MRHSNRNKKFGRVRKVRTALMRSLALALIQRGRIRTTEAKAKALRPFAERIITLSKSSAQTSARLIRARLATTVLLGENLKKLAAAYANRQGGYTRITKVGPRGSDGAKMAIIELVSY